MRFNEIMVMSKYVNMFLEWSVARGYLAQTSISAYGSDLNKFEEFIFKNRNGKGWSKISKEDIEDFIEYLVAEKYEFTSINRMLSALSGLYKYFVDKKMLDVNVVDGVRRLRPSYHEREALPMDIVKKVLHQPNLEASTKAIISLIVESGLRIGEVMSLKYEDVDMKYNQIRVFGKGRSERIVFFGPMTNKYLSEYLRGRCFNGAIFPMSRRQYNWDIYHACKPFAGNHKCSPHILRHTFATECLSNGMPMDVLMLTLGHKSIDTTMLYTHCKSSRSQIANNSFAPRI